MNAYTHSTALAKLQRAREHHQPRYLAFLDVDGTWAGTQEEQQTVRDLLEVNQYVVTAVTNRASELCLDLNADILAASFGTELLVKQKQDGYQPDVTYLQRLPQAPSQWHARVTQLLEDTQKRGIVFQVYQPLDIAPTELRIQLLCDSPETAKRTMVQLQPHATSASLHLARDDQNLVLTPTGASKEDAVDHIVTTLTHQLNLVPADFHVLIAGDSMADLPMGLHAGAGTHATFLIPGGASLTHELKMTKTEKDDTLRAVVIGDETFPGTVGPATLIAWLRQEHS